MSLKKNEDSKPSEALPVEEPVAEAAPAEEPVADEALTENLDENIDSESVK